MRVLTRAAAAAALIGILFTSGCATSPGSDNTVIPSVDGPQLGDVALDDDVRDATVLVVGDSLAHAFGEGMSDTISAGEARDVTIVNAAIGGCGLLLSVEQQVAGTMSATNPECNTWTTRWPELVAEYQPDYVYLSTSFWDVAPQVLLEGGPTVSMADEAVQQRWIDNAKTAVELLSAGGAHVYLDDVNADGMHTVQERTVEEIASAQVTLLPLREQMCDSTECPASIDGIQVLDDTGHPAGQSRDRLARWILNRMFSAA